MKKLSVYCFLLVTAFLYLLKNSKAQEPNYNIMEMEDFIYYQRLTREVMESTKKPYAQVKGNPYLFKDFVDGEIFITDSNRYKGKINYNIYENEIEYLVNDNNYWISNPWLLDHVRIDSVTFIYYSEKDHPKRKGSYYILLVDGECKLLLKKSVILHDAVPPKAYVEAKPAEFVDGKDFYYILFNDSEPEKPERINSKRELRKLFSGKGDKIKKYIKDVSVRNEEDLVRVVKYYNGIL